VNKLLTNPPGEAAEAESYQNPIQIRNDEGRAMDAADPFVLRFNGRYYLYTTGRAEICVYESENLVHWTFRGCCTQGGQVENAYAPEVLYWRGMFYMITSPKGNGHYILRSDSPLGPFEKITGNFGHAIDGSFFTTDDGRLWMLCLENRMIAQTELDPDTLLPMGPKQCTGATLHHWTEGPGLIRRGEWCYLTLTGNHFLSTGYRVAWASRKGSVLGAYTQREDSTLLISSVQGSSFTGLGHSSNFVGPDLESLYTSYHCHGVSEAGRFVRWYSLDRLLTNGGALYTTGPTHTPMPVPAMPEVHGDLQGNPGGFAEAGNGWFAKVRPGERFTQECNFLLTGGDMAWRLGSCREGEALLTTDGHTLCLVVGGKSLAQAAVPELGASGRLHTLCVECTTEVLYASIDTLRLLTVQHPGITADRVGALKRDRVAYGFVAHTGRALGDGDALAMKTIPGRFAAVHGLGAAGMKTVEAICQEERAALLGEVSYAVRVAGDGQYCFDLTVRAQDAGKRITLMADGAELLALCLPPCPEKGREWHTFTTPSVWMSVGDHTMTITGDDAALLTVRSFAWAGMGAKRWCFSGDDPQGMVLLGDFTIRDGALTIGPEQSGFALFGDQGATDYEMRVSFLLPRAGNGDSGFLMRASEVSLYDAQVAESAFAYAIGLTGEGITLRRMNYGAPSEVKQIPIPAWAGQTEATLIMQVKGNILRVYLPGAATPLAEEAHAEGFTHGLCGVYGLGGEMTVTALAVQAWED